jgi:hypothetical protein
MEDRTFKLVSILLRAIYSSYSRPDHTIEKYQTTQKLQCNVTFYWFIENLLDQSNKIASWDEKTS